jgi:hypothetical protein
MDASRRTCGQPAIRRITCMQKFIGLQEPTRSFFANRQLLLGFAGRGKGASGAFMPKHCVLSYRITLTNPRITMQFKANTEQISLQTFSSYPNCFGSLL